MPYAPACICSEMHPEPGHRGVEKLLKYKLSGLTLLALAALVLLGLQSANGTDAAHARPGEPVKRQAVPAITPTATPSCAGAFSRVSSPNIEPGDDYLNSMAVIASDDAWSVGSYSTGPTGGTLTEHWDGVQWSIVPSPNASEGHNGLMSVSALSSDDVWAVGHANSADGMLSQNLIEHWDGATWSIVPSPNIGMGSNILYGVEAIAPDDVWAVGSFLEEPTAGSRTLTLHWDGVEWSVVPSPNGTLTRSNALTSISALASDDVWAVGSFMGSDTEALIEHWDGTQWTIVPAASPGLGSKQLNSVHAISPDNVWSVGQYYTYTVGVTQYLIERWDGTQWSVVPGPNLGGALSSLKSVSGLTSDDVWAVGLSDFNPFHTLVAHWDGAQWSVVPSWSASSGSSTLSDVFPVSRDQVWAVGTHGEVGSHRTLVEAYGSPCATLTPVATYTSTSTPTATVAPPTNTSTATPTATPTATAAASATPTCTLGSNYLVATSTGATMVPANNYVPGSTCNGCVVNITLPFTYSLYDTPYGSVSVSSRGNLQFNTSDPTGNETCLPAAAFGAAIIPYWDDITTNINDTMGIFTSVSGEAPNRVFNIRWAGGYVSNDAAANFQVRLFEGQPRFEIIYGNVTRRGFSATIGVQNDGHARFFTRYSCDTNGAVQSGTRLVFDRRSCAGVEPDKR